MIVGYFIKTQKGEPMNMDDRDGLLYFGSAPTLFPERGQAKKAIRRTIKSRPTFEDEFGELLIRRVTSAHTRWL